MANQQHTFKRDTIRFTTEDGLTVEIRLQFYRGRWDLVTKGSGVEQRIVPVNGYGVKAIEVIKFGDAVLSETGVQDFGFFGVKKWQFTGLFSVIIKCRTLREIADVIHGPNGKSGLKHVFLPDVFKEARKELSKALASQPNHTLSQDASDTLAPALQKS